MFASDLQLWEVRTDNKYPGLRDHSIFLSYHHLHYTSGGILRSFNRTSEIIARDSLSTNGVKLVKNRASLSTFES